MKLELNTNDVLNEIHVQLEKQIELNDANLKILHIEDSKLLFKNHDYIDFLEHAISHTEKRIEQLKKLQEDCIYLEGDPVKITHEYIINMLVQQENVIIER